MSKVTKTWAKYIEKEQIPIGVICSIFQDTVYIYTRFANLQKD